MRKQKALLKSSTVPWTWKEFFHPNMRKLKKGPTRWTNTLKVGTPNKNRDMCFFWCWNQSWFVAVEVGGSCFVVRSSEDIACRAKREVRKLSGTTCRERDSWLLIFCFLQGFCWDLGFCIATSNSSNLIIPRVSLTESGKKQEAGTWESIPHMYHSVSKGIRQFHLLKHVEA